TAVDGPGANPATGGVRDAACIGRQFLHGATGEDARDRLHWPIANRTRRRRPGGRDDLAAVLVRGGDERMDVPIEAYRLDIAAVHRVIAGYEAALDEEKTATIRQPGKIVSRSAKRSGLPALRVEYAECAVEVEREPPAVR